MKPPSRTAGPFRFSVTESIIFGSAALLLLAVMLLTLFLVQQQAIGVAQSRDLARMERYIRLARMALEAPGRAANDGDTRREIRDLGLALDVFPPDQQTPVPQARYLAARQAVEVWDRVRGPDGEPAAVIRLGGHAESTRLTLQVVRYFTMAGLLGGLLLIGTMWWTLRRTVFRPLHQLAGELSSRTTARTTAAAATADPVGTLTVAVREALAAQDSVAARRQTWLDHHGEAACTGTADGTLLEVNAACSRLFGKSRDELVGTNHLDLIPPADRSEVLHHLRKLSARHPESTVEHRVVLPDGTVRWMRRRDLAMLRENGTVREILSFSLDITGERNLADRIETLRGAFDQMQSLARTGSLTWDLAADRIELTNTALHLLGLEAGDAPPSPARLLAAVAPADREAVGGLIERARETGAPFEHEFGVALPGGSRRVLQSRGEVRADPRTKLLTQLTCTFRDITALRAAEAATRREFRFREAVEQSLASGILASADDGRILSVNPAFCAMTGWTEKELLGRGAPYPYWPEEELPAIRHAFDMTLVGRTPPGGYELRFCRKDGSRFDVLVNVAPLFDDRDRRLGWLGAVTDITAIQQVRRELTVAHERLAAALEGGRFGTFEHVIGQGDCNWNLANYEINGIATSVTDPAELFTAWKKVTGEFFPELMATLSALPPTQTNWTYEFTARPAAQEPRRVRVSVFIERDNQGSPVRLVGITRRLG